MKDGPKLLSLHALMLSLGLIWNGTAVAAATGASEQDHIRVIGSRAAASSVLDSPLPVDIFSGEDLRAAGAVGNELGEALAILAPSFNFPRQSNSVTSDHVRAAQLRGMNPDQVLVLVNGKRRHPSAVVNDNTKIGRGTNAFDFNTIPLSAVLRVEILRDGASAQYGSDAIAGVINIVLDDHPDELRTGASFGGHRARVGPIDRTVTDGQTFHVYLNHGVPVLGTGFLRYGAEFTTRNATNRAGLDQISPFIPQTEANLAFRGQQTHRVGDPNSDAFSAWFNGEIPSGQSVFYGFGTLALRQTDGADIFRHPETNQNVREVFPDGFLPITEGDNLDLGLTVGLRNLLADWRLDHSASLGYNEFEFGVRNSLNAALGPASPTDFDSGRFEFTQLNLNSEALRSLAWNDRRAPLDVALGIDYRYERFESSAGDEASFLAGDFRFDPALEALVGFPDIGSQAAKGLTPDDEADEDRHVIGLYVDLSQPIGERLLLGVAGRFEHYSDFGSALAGKFSLRYALDHGLALRGSVSNSFRAPSLSQIGWSRRDNTFSAEGGRISSRLVRAGSPIAEALGVTELDEETSLNVSLGMTWESDFGLRMSTDLFQIEVDDRITLTEFIRDAAVIEAVQALPGGEGVQAVAFFANAADTRTRGIESTASWAGTVGGGLLRVDVGYTYAQTDIQSFAALPDELAAINPEIELVGVAERNTIQTASPRHAATSTVSWQAQRLRLLGRGRFYSSVVREFTFARQRFGAQQAFDAELGYRLTPAWELSVGANNLFDQFPDRSANANNFFGNFAFDPINPIGLNGRFVYLRTELRF